MPSTSMGSVSGSACRELTRSKLSIVVISFCSAGHADAHGLKNVDGGCNARRHAGTELDAINLDGVGLGQRLQGAHQVEAFHCCHLLLLWMVDLLHFPSQWEEALCGVGRKAADLPVSVWVGPHETEASHPL